MKRVDFLIVGGGVIGLSLAYELAREGASVRLLERGPLGREASWAGAGIFPPATNKAELPPWESLRALSHELHPRWAERLRAETGIDNGYRRCGGIYLARQTGEAAALHASAAQLRADGAIAEKLSAQNLAEIEPALRHLAESDDICAAYLLPDEAQIRNPRHLKALAHACRLHGAQLTDQTAVSDFQMQGKRIAAAVTNRGTFPADRFCLATGAWTEKVAAALEFELPMYPVRGQMVLYQLGQPKLQRIVSEGPRYLVPRDDGRLLAGSTEEDVGFDKATTPEGLHDLKQFAASILPELAHSEVESCWAGLRPHSIDGFPYLGKVPHLENCFVAAGHYRSGLHLSTGTAVVMCRLMRGEDAGFDLSAFRVDR